MDILKEKTTENSINLMIVDDAPIVRKFYLRMIEDNPHVNVVAIAENGLEALLKQRSNNIDVIILDIEMPIMNGLEALTKLLYYDPELMVIIASTLNWENAEITHIALNNGAADYLEKPSAVRGNLTPDEFREYMNEKILTLGLKRQQKLKHDSNYSHALEQKRSQLSTGRSPQDQKDNSQAHDVKKIAPRVNSAAVLDVKTTTEKNTPQTPPTRQKNKQEAPVEPAKIAKAPPKPAFVPMNTGNRASTTADRARPETQETAKVPPKKETVLKHKEIFIQAQKNTKFDEEKFTLRAVPKNFRPKAIALGASTGGPPLVQALVPQLATLNLPIFLTQHMPKFFTGVLAEQIATRNQLKVNEVVGDDTFAVENNGIYVAHGGSHMGLKRQGNQVIVFEDSATPAEHCCKPSVEVMVRHMMDVYDKDILMIVLTGMGRDGSNVAETLADKGGVVAVQDQATSLIWGMPGSIMRKGCATVALPPDQILAWCKKLMAGQV